jgi:hypothetical protein
MFQALSSSQQSELLSLAERQGLLYAHQLPPLLNGAVADSNHSLLGRLLNDQDGTLDPSHPDPISVIDSDLDPTQREAVSRAVHSPDVCLIQGLPGSGKSRVAAEIITQAAARGERVLLLAKSPAALDRVLEWIGARPELLAVRCLDSNESLDKLPDSSRSCSFAEQARRLAAHAHDRTRTDLAAAEERCVALRRDKAAWPMLNELACSWEALERKLLAISSKHAQLGAEVENEAAGTHTSQSATVFVARILACTRSHHEECSRLWAELADLRRQIDLDEAELAEVTAKLATLRPFAQVKDRRQWWTVTWWRATLRRDWRDLYEDAETTRQNTEDQLDRSRNRIAEVHRRRQQADEAFENERGQIIEREIAFREKVVNQEEAVIRHEQTLLEQKWKILRAGLSPYTSAPGEITSAAVESACRQWQTDLENEECQQKLRHEWLRYLERGKDALASRLPEFVNVVAATPAALDRDPHFGNHVTNGHVNMPSARPPTPGRGGEVAQFDLLVFEDADQLTDAEFAQMAGRARRWTLLVDRIPVCRGAPAREHGSSAKEISRASARPQPFQRLWQRLHCDALSLPYAWIQDNKRLRCRLQSVLPNQHQWIEVEKVADSPDIELHILAIPDCPPKLVEVAFPLSISVGQAKQFIFRELGELPVKGRNRYLRWVEEPERVVLGLSDESQEGSFALELEAGVRERLITPPTGGDHSTLVVWHTCSLEFDKRFGWDRRRAENWIHQYLGLRDSGRTVVLERLHRLAPSLREFVNTVLDGEDARLGEETPSPLTQADRAAEFIPVPARVESKDSIRDQGKTRKLATVSEASRPSQSKGGAGFEVDLAGTRQQDRLPGELYVSLPPAGTVNYYEAQAVMHKMAELAHYYATPNQATPAIRAEKLRPSIAIIALMPAQVELLRSLIRQLPASVTTAFDWRVAGPTEFCHREADIVLLSLTRSHTHRAVAFSEDPKDLVLAFTRARSKLIVFGDLGTLLRRSQWQGPLDRLNETAANQERELISRLIHYFQGHGGRPSTTQLSQASGP